MASRTMADVLRRAEDAICYLSAGEPIDKGQLSGEELEALVRAARRGLWKHVAMGVDDLAQVRREQAMFDGEEDTPADAPRAGSEP